MSRTLVTGFGPFGDVTDNPSARLAEGCGRPFRLLEVTFEAVDRFLGELDATSFDRFVLMGVAAGRTQITPEQFARNAVGRRKDVSGIVRLGDIEAGSPLLLEGTLWTPELLSRLVMEEGVAVSLDAGNYLCNYIYYRALQRFPAKRVGFLHVPKVDAIALDRQAEIVLRCLEVMEAE